MKEQRFIELLNLYIDRQISPEETAELEVELQVNPKRRAIYHQYCQIHKATKLVYESFRSVAAEQKTATAGRPGVVELFESRRRRNSWLYYTGGLAAAACLTFAIVRFSFSTAEPASVPVLAAQTRPAEAVAAVAPAAVPAAVGQPASSLKANPISLRNTIEVPADYAALLAALREQDEERYYHGERVQTGYAVQSLFADDAFEVRPVLTAQPGQRVFRGKQTPAQQAEFSAFQFQR